MHKRKTNPPRFITVLGVGIAATFVFLLVILHVTGVLGPGAH